ncbi:MAG: hypothetical protein KatS3mg109_1182 [Pirellulaceae bacterium]|nr:MAG: hypothetical protein KatS3mg109_1182 [Pirellulaceae bacterium]GIW94263.1 MAG: hypothetical protein KatS3mg110_2304 [Pirellulaceae bacterium]
MTTAIQKVAKNVLKHFGKSLFPHAVYIRTPMPKRTPLRELNVPDELAVDLRKV